jgi:uncharacterized protein (TIGR03435 family)
MITVVALPALLSAQDAALAKPMPAEADPVFEVATIKATKPGTLSVGFAIRGRQLYSTNTSLTNLIMVAYGLQARQILGGPAWIEAERYDLTAKPEGDSQPDAK